jgi:hypothetical protein
MFLAIGRTDAESESYAKSRMVASLKKAAGMTGFYLANR